MNDADAEKIRTRPREGAIVCASCAGSPTCPMLNDALWEWTWSTFCSMALEDKMPVRELRCTLSTCRHLEYYSSEEHGVRCEMTHQERRHLLCFECTEKVMGRPLTLEDLSPCPGNYAHYVMQKRVTP